MDLFKRKKQDEVLEAEAVVEAEAVLDSEIEEPEKQKLSKIDLASFIITILSSAYTMATVIMFVVENWVPSAFSTALKVLLVSWVVAFIVIMGFSIATRDTKKTKKYLGTYKKLIKLFKGFVNVLFLTITAVSMVGIVKEGVDGIVQMVVMAFSVISAAAQLAVNTAKFIMKSMLKHHKEKKKKEKAERKAQKEAKKLARK